MTLRDVGEIVVFLLACMSIPTLYALSKGNKGESSANSKVQIIWPILVSAFCAYRYYWPNSFLSILIGGSMFGLLCSCGITVWLDRKFQEKASAKEEMKRKDEEIRQLRKEIRLMQEEEKDDK